MVILPSLLILCLTSQSILHTAASVIFLSCKCDHVSLLLKIPVHYRIHILCI